MDEDEDYLYRHRGFAPFNFRKTPKQRSPSSPPPKIGAFAKEVKANRASNARYTVAELKPDPSMSLRSSWSSFRQRRHPTAARIAIVGACVLAAVYSWPLGSIMLRLYFPEPGRRCGTPEVFALLAGAVIVAPAALLLGAIQIPARRELHDRPAWRTASLAGLALLLLLVLANWLALIKLVWL